MHPVLFDSAGRVKVTTLSGGTAPSNVVNGTAFSAAGRVLFNPDAAAGTTTLNVNRLGPNQNIYVTTTVAATDTFVNGFRYSATGQLVYVDGGTPVVFVNGKGFDANGALCTTEL